MNEAADLVAHGARFNFRRELRKARRTLEERVAAYAAEHPELGYRDLRDTFKISLGAVSKIMRRYRKRQEARERKRLAERPATFIVRHKERGQDVTTVVTVTGRATIDQKRHVLSRMYKTAQIVEGDDASVLRRTEYVIQRSRMGRGWKTTQLRN
jgi:hypothetical protein